MPLRPPPVVRRLVLVLLGCLAALGALAPPALAHAVLISAAPAPQTRLAASPPQVTLRFSEPVELLRAADLDVVDDRGSPVAAGPGRRSPQDASELEIPLRPSLPDGTYTARYRILSADSHVIGGALVFGVGGGALGDAFLGGPGRGGPGETSPWAVSARFFELVGLGGLLALLSFRWLVWRPAWRRPLEIAPAETEALLAWGRDRFWSAFWILAGGAVLAEAYLLLTKSAVSLGASVWGTLADSAGIVRVLSDSRFGSLFQWRGVLLVAVLALGLWEFASEPVMEKELRPDRGAGRPLLSALLGSLVLAALAMISYQGHASQAPLASLSILDDVIHLAAVSVWIGGLALLGLVLVSVARIGPTGGPALAASVLACFSRLALVAVAVAVTTGALRAAAELADPAQLWGTAYGRSIVYKVLLLCPIAFLALRNRRVVVALERRRPNEATLRMVKRNAQLELGLALGIVVVASLLVAQVPGRAAASGTRGASREESAPLTGDPRALMLAGHSRDVLIGLAARAGGPVDVVALASGQKPLETDSLRITVESRTARALEPTTCGMGCFRIAERVLSGSPVGISVEVVRPGEPTAAVAFRLPSRLPASGSELFRAASRTMGALRTVRLQQSLSSGTLVFRSRYAMRAPDRVRFQTATGQKSILIGRRRWDWQEGRWVRSPFPGVRAPTYPWEGATSARLLGRAKVGGEPVRVLALFRTDSQLQVWFRLFVAADARVLRAEMLAPGHFMIDRYSGFNEPVTIEPPKP